MKVIIFILAVIGTVSIYNNVKSNDAMATALSKVFSAAGKEITTYQQDHIDTPTITPPKIDANEIIVKAGETIHFGK
jgi:hypothetical protein